MIVNLVPDFLDAVQKHDPVAGYFEHIQRHESILPGYWSNYVVDPFGPHAEKVIGEIVRAPWTSMLDVDHTAAIVRELADLLDRLTHTLAIDSPIDIYLVVGAGTVHVAELMANGRGALVICMEHFTTQAHPKDIGRRMAPDLISLWAAHGLAHLVRYSSKSSHSEIPKIIADTGGTYDHWEVGSRTTLAELLVNEGLAVAVAKHATPRRAAHHYFDYGAAAYRRIRRLEGFLRRTVQREFHQTGIGYRLRYFTRGVSASSRIIDGRVIPERCGFYLGYRLVQPNLEGMNLAKAVRAAPSEFLEPSPL